MARAPTPVDPESVSDDLDAEIMRLTGEDDGPPSGAQHGETHTRRPLKTEADRDQGPKTRAANRERAKGSRGFNP